jgi:hypothetical protein
MPKTWRLCEMHIALCFPHYKWSGGGSCGWSQITNITINSTQNSLSLFYKIVSGGQPRQIIRPQRILWNTVAAKTSKLIPTIRYVTNTNTATIQNLDVCIVFSGYSKQANFAFIYFTPRKSKSHIFHTAVTDSSTCHPTENQVNVGVTHLSQSKVQVGAG